MTRTGRPKAKNPVNKQLTVRLDENTEKRLVAYCEKHNITRGEAVRKGVLLLLVKEKE